MYIFNIRPHGFCFKSFTLMARIELFVCDVARMASLFYIKASKKLTRLALSYVFLLLAHLALVVFHISICLQLAYVCKKLSI